MTTIRYMRPGGGRLQLSEEVVAIFRQFVQDRGEKDEAGGVLLGRFIRDTAHIVVDAVSIPQPGDRRFRHAFHRRRRRHQGLIDRLWVESSGTCTYLGEWHTHPEDVPDPSCVDRREWGRKLLTDTYSGSLFFVIVGTQDVRVWEGFQNGTIVALH